MSKDQIVGVYLHPGVGVSLIGNRKFRAKWIGKQKCIAIGAASVNSMNRSELKSLLAFHYSINIVESNIVYKIIDMSFVQLVSVLSSLGWVVSSLSKLMELSVIIRLLLFPTMFVWVVFYGIILSLSAALKVFLIISVPIRRKNVLFAAKCAVEAAGREAFVHHLLRQNAAAQHFGLVQGFLKRAYWRGYVSPDLYRHMDQVGERCQRESLEPSKQGPSALTGKSKRRKKRTTKEEWDYYQKNIFEEGKLEDYAMSFAIRSEMDRRPAWHLFNDGNSIKMKLTAIHYDSEMKKGRNKSPGEKQISSEFVDGEIGSEVIPDQYYRAYHDRDIEIDHVKDLAKEVNQRKIFGKELRRLIAHQPSLEMEKSVARLREIRLAESRHLDTPALLVDSIDSPSRIPIADSAPSHAGADREAIQSEFKSVRKQISERDREFFWLQCWLDPTSENHCGEVFGRYLVQIEVQKKLAKFSQALILLGDFLIRFGEGESMVYVEEDWNQIAADAKQAIQSLMPDLPENMRFPVLFLPDAGPLRQDLWAEEETIHEVLNGDWSFSPEFAEQLQSLLDHAVARLKRIRFLGFWTILHNYELAAIAWLEKNGA